MDSRKRWPSTLEEQERIRLKKKEWVIQQKLERKHEERKLKMIKEYERKRAESIGIDGKQKSLRQSKSVSPQRRGTSFPDYEHSKDHRQRASVMVNGPEGIFIDKRNLHKIKINIYQGNSLPTKDQSTSRKIERDIINPDDIILPRRQNEGACPMFNKNEITETEEIRTVTFSQEKASTSRKNVSTCRRSPDNDIIQHHSKVFIIGKIEDI